MAGTFNGIRYENKGYFKCNRVDCDMRIGVVHPVWGQFLCNEHSNELTDWLDKRFPK